MTEREELTFAEAQNEAVHSIGRSKAFFVMTYNGEEYERVHAFKSRDSEERNRISGQLASVIIEELTQREPEE